MNKIHEYRILIFTEDPHKLAKFYQDVLGLETITSLNLIDDTGYLLKINPSQKLWIGYHSEIHGTAKEPFRHIYNLHVDSVTLWYEKIKDHSGVTIVTTPRESPISTPKKPDYVSTWLDPESNCWQFRGPK